MGVALFFRAGVRHPADPPVAPACWYLLACRTCGFDPTAPDADPGRVATFPTADARGRWAALHRLATGHDAWWAPDIHGVAVARQAAERAVADAVERRRFLDAEVARLRRLAEVLAEP